MTKQQFLPGLAPPTIPRAYERIPAPRGPADTSQAAAAEADRTGRSKSKRSILLEIIRGTGERGATIDELQQATGWLVQSICPAVKTLERAGEIIDSGRRRATRTGTPAKVWTSTGRATR